VETANLSATAILIRLQRLERSKHCWRVAFVVLGLVSSLGVLLGAQQPKPRSIAAQEFLLQDSDGITRAEIGFIDNEPIMRFYSSNKKPILSIGQSKGNPVLRLHDRSEAVRLAITVSDQTPAVILLDGKQKPRVTLGGSPLRPGLYLQDGDGKDRGHLNQSNDVPFQISDEQGKFRLRLEFDKDDTWFKLMDTKGEPRLVLDAGIKDAVYGVVQQRKLSVAVGVVKQTIAGLHLFDANGTRQAAFELLGGHKPRMFLNDEKGNPLFEKP
jgi:hypothetical protein